MFIEQSIGMSEEPNYSKITDNKTNFADNYGEQMLSHKNQLQTGVNNNNNIVIDRNDRK